MAETSAGYCELLDGFPLFPLFRINSAAQIVFFKDALRFLLISVYLLAALALMVAGSVEDESQNVFRRIT